MKKLLLIIICMLSINVYADKCDNTTKKELLKEANEIKVDYDEYEKTEEINDGYNQFLSVERHLNISIYNLTNNLQLEISNDYDDSMMFLDKDDYKEGKYTFQNDKVYTIIKYKIEVYSNTSCDKYLVKTINYTKPMYNSNFDYQICRDNQDVPYCYKYITNKKYVKKFGFGLDEIVSDYKGGNYQEEELPEKNFWQKYHLYIIVGTLGVAAITSIIIYINKKRSEL